MNDNSNNVTVTIESLNIRYNNHRDENRQYDIAASFSVRDTNIDSINNGVVGAKGNEMARVAEFDTISAPLHTSIFDLTVDDIAVYQAIKAFNDSAKAAIRSQLQAINGNQSDNA